MKARSVLQRICLSIGLTCILLALAFVPLLLMRSSSTTWLRFRFPSQAQGSAAMPISGSITYQGDQRILNLWGSHGAMGYAHGRLLAPEIVELVQKYLFQTRYYGSHTLYHTARAWVSGHVTFAAGTYGAELSGMLDGMRDSGVDLTLHITTTSGAPTRTLELADLKLLNWQSRWGDEAETYGPDEVAFTGIVQSRPSGGQVGTWVVGRYAFQADARTQVIGSPAIGSEVRVRARLRDGASPLATEIIEGEGGSSFAVWGDATVSSDTLAARNLDWRYDTEEGIVATYGLLIVYDPEDEGESRFVTLAWPGFIGAPTAFNEHGIFLSSNWGNGPTGVTSGLGSYNYIPCPLIARKAIETADHDDPVGDVMRVVTESKRYDSQILLVSYPYTTYNADQDAARVIEYDYDGATIRPATTVTIAATNHFISRTAANSASASSLARYITITTDLQTYRNDDGILDATEAVTIIKHVTWPIKNLAAPTTSTLHSLTYRDVDGVDVYFARVEGYDPVTITAAPYGASLPVWSNWVTSQTYRLSDLFPNHPDTPTATLTHGPVVGAVTSSTARIFVRTSLTAPVQIAYGLSDNAPFPWQSDTLTPTLDADYTAQITLTNSMTPATTYYYDVLVDGASQFTVPHPSFRTFPPEGASGTFTVVVLSDFATTYKAPADVDTFTQASHERPGVVLIGGDFDHRNARGESDKRQMYQALYSRENHYEDFVDEILRKYPVAHGWNDHDYGEDDADGSYPYKARSLQVLQEYFPLYPLSDNTENRGDWQTFTYGPAQFFLLDSRSQRDHNDHAPWSEKSMLGAGQLAWLTQTLSSSQAVWKVIVSPVVFNTTTVKLDAWYGYQAEKEKLLDFINDPTEPITGVIVVSGDLHFGAIDDGTHSGLPEMLVPSPNFGACLISVGYGDSPGDWSRTYSSTVGSCDGYGALTFDTDDGEVLLEVKNSTGTVMISQTVGL